MTFIVDCGEHSFKVGELTKNGSLIGPKVFRVPRVFGESLVDLGFWETFLGYTKGDSFVVSLPISSLRRSREELCRFLFETLEASAVSILSSTHLATLAAGLETALVVDIGQAGTRVTCVEDGYPLPHCSAFGGVGGAELTSKMSLLEPKADAERLKEDVASVAEEKNSKDSKDSKFRCGEVLFDASGTEISASETLPELVMTSLRLQSNINLRGKLLEHVLVIGGTSKLNGLQRRLRKELLSRSKWIAPGHALESTKIECCGPHAAWNGAALLAQCPIFKELLMSRKQYEASGPQIVHQNFF